MWVECVPNFSDGRDPAVLEALRQAVLSVEGTRVLDASQDADHNRAVLTFAAPPEQVVAAAFAAVSAALERIDLRSHGGVHPRIGAADVVPLVPLAGLSLADCVPLAHALGERLARELELPVFFYGAAARRAERSSLPAVRRAATELPLAPDAGPARLHPRGGGVAVGARDVLIAFNVNLDTNDIALARRIARTVRAANGGLPGVRALGLALERGGVVQVSMNLCEPDRTGIEAAFLAVERLAGEHGVGIRASELIGLAPRAALDAAVAERVRLPGFDPRRHIIEDALEARA